MENCNQHDYDREAVSELQSLLAKRTEGALSQTDLARVAQLLKESSDARIAYVDAVHLDEGIRRWSHQQGEADVLTVVDLLQNADGQEFATRVGDSGELAANDVAAVRDYFESRTRLSSDRESASIRSMPMTHLIWRGMAAFAIAAALLLAFSLWRNETPRHDSPDFAKSPFSGNLPVNNVIHQFADSENVVARVTSGTNDLRWAQGRGPLDFLMRFYPGDVLGIEQGMVQLEFSSGATLVVEAPAVLQVTGATSARLVHGRVVGEAENGNFTLLTPTANVVDIGTEFGVDVSGEGTDVTVFEGEVHVHPLLGQVNAASIQKLQEGMSVRIDSRGLSKSAGDEMQLRFRRSLHGLLESNEIEQGVSMLDLLGGNDAIHHQIAGSIDPKTGYWGRPPWLDPRLKRSQRGDTQFTQADWNPMVDGVFIPRANAREMQIDSDGHMVYLPPNSGSSWGPIWARRRFGSSDGQALLSSSEQAYWGAGVLAQVIEQLQQSRAGLMGLHANVGITFDLNAVRQSRARQINYFKAVVANLDSSSNDDLGSDSSMADLRIFVNGKLRYSRLQFGRGDGEAAINIAISDEDRFLTIVTTDAGSNPLFDHVVLIDPTLEYAPPPQVPENDQA